MRVLAGSWFCCLVGCPGVPAGHPAQSLGGTCPHCGTRLAHEEIAEAIPEDRASLPPAEQPGIHGAADFLRPVDLPSTPVRVSLTGRLLARLLTGGAK